MDDIQASISSEERPRKAAKRTRKSSTDEFGRPLSLLDWKPIDLEKLTPPQLAACHELFRRGDISWFLHPEQKKLLDWLDAKKRDIAVICISRQWGKSLMTLAYALAYCIRHPRSNVLFVAPLKSQLANYLIPKLNQVFAFMPEDLIPVRRDMAWTFPNGSIFRGDGISAGKGARIRGEAAHLVILDECRDMHELQETIESHISPMLTTTDGNIVCISTPPESPLHAFTDKYIRDGIASGNFYAATYKQNPLLSTKRLRYLMNTLHPGGEENVTFRREYMADWSVTDESKRVVREWDEEANDAFFAEYAGPPNPCRVYVGLDYGFGDPCGIIIGYYDHMDGVLVIEDEHMQRGMNTDEVGLKVVEMENALKQRHPGMVAHEPIRIMDIDPSLMADLHTRFNLRFEPAFKVPSVTTMLNRLRVSILEGRIRVADTCPNLRFQLKAGVFKGGTGSNASGEYLRTEKGGHLDLLDALKYLNLNCRWNEILARQTPDERLGQNQMRIGPFVPQNGSFRSGFMRPR